MDREAFLFLVSWVPCGHRVSSSVKENESLMEKSHANISYKPRYDICSLKQSTLLFSVTLRNIMVPVSQMAELRFVRLRLLTKSVTRVLVFDPKSTCLKSHPLQNFMIFQPFRKTLVSLHVFHSSVHCLSQLHYLFLNLSDIYPYVYH